jgi:hypothetical protein
MMKRCVVTVFALSLAVPAGAQWLHYPTPDMPRTKGGKPNLTAPAPRAADGKPELSGIWLMGGLGTVTNITDVEMRPEARAIFEKRRENYAQDDPSVSCLPEGPRSAINGLDPFRIIQSRNMTIVLHEPGTYRVIHTDGRPLPKDMTPTWMGYSIGRWEGETFVVTTAGYNDRTWLDWAGHPHSDALRVTERYRRTDFGHIQVEMTFDDPKAYLKPFTLKLTANFVPDDDLIETVCLENEKDRDKLVGTVADEKRVDQKLPVSALADYAGTYNMGPQGNWTVSASGDSLLIELSDAGGKQKLFPTADNVFVFQAIGGTITFVRDPLKNNAVSHFVLTTVEGDERAERK